MKGLNMQQDQHIQVVGSDEEKKPLRADADRDKPDGKRDPEAAAVRGDVVPEQQTICGMPVQFFAGLSYCASSAGMVLLNKFALSGFDFHSITSLLIFQCTFCVIAVHMCAALGLITLEPWNWQIAQSWFPANIVFVGMLWTSFPALQLLGVGMVTVLKNLTNLFTIFGDIVLYNKSYSKGVWATLGLMSVSALCGAITDLNFNGTGYAWQLLNCLLTAAYALTLRGIMDKVAPMTRNQQKLGEYSMVLYNNVLSLPLLLLAAGINGEFTTILQEPALYNPRFQAAVCMSAICGFLISFCSLWFLSTTTATTYSLVGSLNKLPIAILGLLFFDAVWSTKNIASIAIGLIAGIVFAKAKQGAAPAKGVQPTGSSVAKQ